MEKYNKKAVEAAKRLSNLPKGKLYCFSCLTAKLSSFFIFVGGILFILKKEIWGGGIALFGLASLVTSLFNIFRSKDK